MSDSTGEQSLAVLHSLYEAIERGDVPGAMAFVDPDVVITFPDSMPMGGEWRGHDGLFQLIGKIRALWDERKSVVETSVAEGDTIAVFIMVTGIIKGTPLKMPLAEYWRVRDGKLIEGRAYFFDTAQIVAAAAKPRV
jgi:ketosteroid isomerase-like protein